MEWGQFQYKWPGWLPVFSVVTKILCDTVAPSATEDKTMA